MKELRPTNKSVEGYEAKGYFKYKDLRTGQTVIRYSEPTKDEIKKVALVIIGNNEGYEPGGTRGQDEPGGHDGPGVIGGIGGSGGHDGPGETGGIGGPGGYDGPGGTGGIDGPGGTTGGSTESSKDEEDKKLGKAVAIGVIALASIALLAAIAKAKDIEYTEHSRPSDWTYEIDESDLYKDEAIDEYEELQVKQDENGDWIITNENGEQIKIEDINEKGSSQIENPGEIISTLKERAAAEKLGRRKGRQEHDSTSESERVEEENTINEITEQYDEQAKAIIEARKILENENASEQQKKEALAAIETAKKIQYDLFEENKDLFNKYFNEAINEYTDSQYADENVTDDVEYLISILAKWNNSKDNLKGDIARLNNFDYVLNHPESLFEKPASAEGSIDKDYYIEVGPVKILKSEQREIVKKVYEKKIDTNKSFEMKDGVPTGNGQIGEGTISVESTENLTVETTRYGIKAVVHKFKRFMKNLAKDAKKMIEDVKEFFDNDQEK